jgi:hypothetical protein
MTDCTGPASGVAADDCGAATPIRTNGTMAVRTTLSRICVPLRCGGDSPSERSGRDIRAGTADRRRISRAPRYSVRLNGLRGAGFGERLSHRAE